MYFNNWQFYVLYLFPVMPRINSDYFLRLYQSVVMVKCFLWGTKEIFLKYYLDEFAHRTVNSINLYINNMPKLMVM